MDFKNKFNPLAKTFNFVPKTTITSGTVAPTSTPENVGDIYIDTVAKKLYFSVGTSSSSDWVIAN